MKKIPVLLPLIFIGCSSVSYQEKFDRVEPKGAGVHAPFERMVTHAAQPAQHIGTIYFGYDDAVLSDNAKAGLQAMVEEINRRSGALIIEGHASYENSLAYNKKLGYQRALTAAHYLHDAGVWQERMTIKSFSHTRPAANNHLPNQRPLNRRVDIKMQAQGDSVSGEKAQQLHQALNNAPARQEDSPMMGLLPLFGNDGGN